MAVNYADLRVLVDAILERPQPVIVLENYIGPDRRRVPHGDSPDERRPGEDYWEL